MLPDLSYNVVNKVPFTCWDGVQGAKLHLVNTMPEWKAFFELLMQQKKVACDTETTGFKWFDKDRIVGMSFGWQDLHFYVPVRHVESCLDGPQPPQLDFDTIKPDLIQFFSRTDVITIWHNFKFDAHMYAADGIRIKTPYHDTRIMWQFVDENAPGALKVIATGWRDMLGKWHAGIIGRDANKKEDEIDKWRSAEAKKRRDLFRQEVMARADLRQADMQFQGWKRPQIKAWVTDNELKDHPYKDAAKSQIHYGMVPLQLMTEYAALDTFLTWKLYEHCLPKIQADPKSKTIYMNELKLSTALMETEENGACIDVEYLSRTAKEYEEAIARETKEISEKLGGINISSADQLAQLFTQRGAVLTKKTESGKLCMDKKVMAELAKVYPEAQEILELRKKEKLHGTYMLGILEKLVNGNKLHVSFNQNVATGRMASQEPNCFDRYTELLTPNGWMFIDKVTLDTEVAQWDNGVITFTKPTAMYSGRGNLLHIHSAEQIDICVTANHRCLLRHRKTGKLKVFEADRYPEDYQQLHAGVYPGGSLSLSEDQLILLLATQADGSYTDGGLDFGFKKERKVHRLLRALDSLGAAYSYKIQKNGRHRIRVKKGAVAQWVYSVLTDRKVLGPWILQLDRKSLDLFCDEIFFWDGSWTKKSQYASTLKENTDWVQAALALSNKRAMVATMVNNRGTVCFVVNTTNRDYSMTTNRTVTPLGEDNVFCVSVPSSFLVTRRGRSVAITGNCQNIPGRDTTIRRAFVPPGPDYIYAFLDYSQVEVRLTAHFSQDPLLLDAYLTGQDVHLRTACEMFGWDIEEAKKIHADHSHPRFKELDLQRKISKTINFGLIYGVSSLGLSEQIPRPERYKDVDKETWVQVCESYIDMYFQKYRGVRKFIILSSREIKKTCQATNFFGRVRHLPHAQACKVTKDDALFWMEARAQRQGVNFIVQGTAADVFKIAVVRVRDILKGTRSYLVNFIHDEIQIYFHKDEIRELLPKVKAAMEDFHFRVPLEVDVELSLTNWAEKGSFHLPNDGGNK